MLIMSDAPKIVSARVIAHARREPNELFAVGRNNREEYYFIKRNGRDDDSCLFFDFLSSQVPKTNEIHWSRASEGFQVQLKLYGIRTAVVVAPQPFLEIHKQGQVYMLDTDIPDLDYLLNFELGTDTSNRLNKQLRQINPFISHPAALISEGYVTVYDKSDSFSRDFSNNAGLLALLRNLIEGEDVELQRKADPFSNKVHLIVYNSREVTGAFNQVYDDLEEELGGRLSRYRTV